MGYHFIRCGYDHDGTGLYLVEIRPDSQSVVLKLEKGSPDGSNLVFLGLGTSSADNLASTYDETVIDDIVNAQVQGHQLGPLAFAGTGRSDKGRHAHI
jgi:hypothetical protein